MGEIENESPIPATEEHIETVRNVQIHASPVVHGGTDTGGVGGMYNEVEDKFDSDEDIGDIENEEVVEEIEEQVIKPVFKKKEETFTVKTETVTEAKVTR